MGSEKKMSTGDGTSQSDVFDVRKVRRLVELMNEHELTEIDLRQGEQRIRLRRDQEPAIIAAPVAVPAPAPVAAPMLSAGTPAVAHPLPADDASTTIIKSPMVGTFYKSSSPDAAPFVKVGDQVGPDTTVCIIEAMKVFNEIPADCSGKIVAMLAESGDSVEFGQPLFKVQK